MVKAKNDYDRRMDDSRFKNFDKVLDPSYGQKQYYILIAGLFIICIIFAATTIFNALNAPTASSQQVLYEEGLNISYMPEYKIFSITYSNPKNDVSSIITSIKVPYDTYTSDPYLKVYDYSTSKFPANITYTPSQKVSNLNHIVTVTLIKEAGNYTYAYSTIPDTEDKMWQGTGQYVKKINEVLNKT
jgi:hypothetical protein